MPVCTCHSFVCLFVFPVVYNIFSDDDLFFTELYKIDRKGTGQWESDGGLSTYRPLANIEAPPPPPPLPSEFLSGWDAFFLLAILFVSERFAWGLIYNRCVVKNSVVYTEINRCVAKNNSVCMEFGQVVLKTDQTCLKNSLLVNVSWQRTRLVLKDRPNLPWKQT